ncbi:MAG TPA: hypothetical protein VKV15_26965, partial [Bryobacteraceae bacterium]|nr:hypothetical protein [Bryobacteraceae bacterium]
MEQHVRILGILHIVFGSIGVLIALGIMIFFGGIAGVVNLTQQDADAAVAAPILVAIGGLAMI